MEDEADERGNDEIGQGGDEANRAAKGRGSGATRGRTGANIDGTTTRRDRRRN